MKLTSRSFLLFLILLVISGCNSAANPTIPNETNDTQVINNPNHYIWSYNLISFDKNNPPDSQIEIIPLRNVEVHFNALSWMEKGPCTNCLKIPDGPTPAMTHFYSRSRYLIRSIT